MSGSSVTSAELEAVIERVQALEDELEIRKTLARYTFAVDHRGPFGDIFADDCTFELVDADGGIAHRERDLDELERYMAQSHGADARSRFAEMHIVTSEVTAVVAGDAASCESYFLAFRDYGDGPTVIAFGRYFDDLVKRSGRWLIGRRKAVMGSTMSSDRGPGHPTVAELDAESGRESG